MNDLSLSTDLQKSFPTITVGLKNAQKVLDSIHSFEDVERVFLMGAGLSPHTYRSYLMAVKQLYEFTGGLNPLQITPAHIEKFYDHLVKKVDRNTAYLRIRGLKRFFAGIRNVIPFYTSPFEIMSKNLNQKMNSTKKGNRTKKALNSNELRLLLSWLSQNRSVKGLENYAIVFMLATSGLRGSELCQLRWKDLEFYEGRYTASFIGKGEKAAEQELYRPAVKACKKYFKVAFKRDPRPEDHLFWTIPVYNGDKERPLPYSTLWHRIHKIGETVKEQGIIKRDLVFSPHLFRRTYATGLYKSGMGIKAIQGKTRHSNINVLMKHYIHDEELAAPYLDKMLA
jgi:integrase